MISPLRILTLYRQLGLVHTHALNWIDAPWLPKSDSGTRSPAPHFRHRGNVNSTPVAPSSRSRMSTSAAGPRQPRQQRSSGAWTPPARCPLVRFQTALRLKAEALCGAKTLSTSISHGHGRRRLLWLRSPLLMGLAASFRPPQERFWPHVALHGVARVQRAY